MILCDIICALIALFKQVFWQSDYLEILAQRKGLYRLKLGGMLETLINNGIVTFMFFK